VRRTLGTRSGVSTSASSPWSTSQFTACSTLSVPVPCSARTPLLREKPIASSSANRSALTSGSTCARNVTQLSALRVDPRLAEGTPQTSPGMSISCMVSHVEKRQSLAHGVALTARQTDKHHAKRHEFAGLMQ